MVVANLLAGAVAARTVRPGREEAASSPVAPGPGSGPVPDPAARPEAVAVPSGPSPASPAPAPPPASAAPAASGPPGAPVAPGTTLPATTLPALPAAPAVDHLALECITGGPQVAVSAAGPFGVTVTVVNPRPEAVVTDVGTTVVATPRGPAPLSAGQRLELGPGQLVQVPVPLDHPVLGVTAPPRWAPAGGGPCP